MIRQAIDSDLDVIASMGTRFIQYTGYAGLLSPDPEELRETFLRVQQGGAIFVAEVEGIIHGFLAAMIIPLWFSPSTKVAMELAWWLEPEYRNGTTGIRLMQAYEQWAKDEGARIIAMSDLDIDGTTPITHLLKRMNYKRTEQTHIKEI